MLAFELPFRGQQLSYLISKKKEKLQQLQLQLLLFLLLKYDFFLGR